MILKAVRHHKIGESNELVDQERRDVLIIDNIERAFQLYDGTGSKFVDFTRRNEATETLPITKVKDGETEVRFDTVFLMNDKGETIERLF